MAKIWGVLLVVVCVLAVWLVYWRSGGNQEQAY